MPVNHHVVEYWIELRIDVISLAFREYYVATVTTDLEGSHDGRHIIRLIALSGMDSTCRPAITH